MEDKKREQEETKNQLSPLEIGIYILEFVKSKLNLTDSLTEQLNRKLVEETSMGMGHMPITKVKGDGNPTC